MQNSIAMLVLMNILMIDLVMINVIYISKKKLHNMLCVAFAFST